ncbi:MAG: hypothetical protein ABIU20_07010 [Blastocatellia bacterium]
MAPQTDTQTGDQRGNQLLVGINYPWIDYGWDFGDPPAAWVNAQNLPAWREQKRKRIVEDFARFADLGLFGIRWFILPDGTNYGTGNDAPQKLNNHWAFNPLPSRHAFHEHLAEDFEFVLQTCARLRLQLVPSLIDFHWCHHGQVADAQANIVKGGRADIVNDDAKRNAFFDAVLEPLLEVSLRYPQIIYAWELMNEPEWVTAAKPRIKYRPEENKTVRQGAMLDFLHEGIRRINSKCLPNGEPAFRSTIGFAHYDTLFDWDSRALGVTLHQFHFYAQKDGRLPKNVFSDEYSCFIGEFATAVQKDWTDLKKKKLDQTIPNRLNWIGEKGYPAAFLWSAQAVDVATNWTPREIEGTVAYIASLGTSNSDAA